MSALAGDFTRSAFPQGVDVVVMASNLPQYEPELIRLVVGKAFAALVPGGEMHLIGETLHDDRRGPLSAALWGLNEAVQGSTGLRPHRGRGERLPAGRGIHRRGRASVRARRAVARGRAQAGLKAAQSGVAPPGAFDYLSPPASLPSSRGLGRGPLKAETRVRIP